MSIASFTDWMTLTEASLPSGINSYAEKMAGTLAPHELRLLRHYSNAFYGPINAVMRGQSSYAQWNKPKHVSKPGFHRMVVGAGKALSKVFSKYQLPESVTVYRFTPHIVFKIPKTKSESAENRTNTRLTQLERRVQSTGIPADFTLADYYAPMVKFLAQSLQGTTHVLRGLVSTTTSLTVAENFWLDNQYTPSIILTGTLPRGASAIPLGPKISDNYTEAEILLPDNTRVTFPSGPSFTEQLEMMLGGERHSITTPVTSSSFYYRHVFIVPVTYDIPTQSSK